MSRTKDRSLQKVNLVLVFTMECIGIDIGGSGVRLGQVDVTTGALVSEVTMLKHTTETSANAILANIREALKEFPEDLPVGVGFPGVVQNSLLKTAPNLGSTWAGTNLSHALHRPMIAAINDADAAAMAEQAFGSSKGENGTVLMVTVGTGIGTALHRNGVLIPNLEFGLLAHPTRGGRLEEHASGRARTIGKLSLDEWALRFQEVLNVYEAEFKPDVIVVGGGITEHWEAWAPLVTVQADIRKARFGNLAGLVGSSLLAAAKANR